MKTILTLGLLAYSLVVVAQTKIEKTFPTHGIQKLELVFDYPELVQVHTWDQKDVLIKGSVTINAGENDNAFQLTATDKGGVLQIVSELKDKDNIPRRTVIRKGDQEYVFKAKDASDPEVQKFLNENGRDYTYISNGIQYDIQLEIFVPKGMECRIDSKFGLVEITNFDGPLTVNAPHGGIDATITSAVTGQLTARTRFGEILTNLDTKFNPSGDGDDHGHWTEVSAKIGTGPPYSLESKFGKVYLRKPAK